MDDNTHRNAVSQVAADVFDAWEAGVIRNDHDACRNYLDRGNKWGEMYGVSESDLDAQTMTLLREVIAYLAQPYKPGGRAVIGSKPEDRPSWPEDEDEARGDTAEEV